MTQTICLKRLPLIFATLLFGACQVQSPIAAPKPALSSRGHTLAVASCGACHAVDPNLSQSPNPDAPSFPAIVNKEGLTTETLSVWLRDAHNYPNEMQFELEPGKVEDLVTYMLTLKDPNYRPSN